ncbi:MAG: hypothetical protein M1820_001228 [Bogoriella megaspora]|nr:MAG: hypothetical protein M1820_001228 [Bogoriella megaspora]
MASETDEADPSIIYQNADHTVTLLDIPRSIAVAQGFSNDFAWKVPYSCEPPHVPFQSYDPKSAAATSDIGLRPDSELHENYASIVETALGELRAKHGGPWCLPRKWHAPSRRISKKRKATELEADAPDAIETSKTVHRNCSNDLTIKHRGQIVHRQDATAHLPNIEQQLPDSILVDIAHGDIQATLSRVEATGHEIFTFSPGSIPSSENRKCFHNDLTRGMNLVLSIPSKSDSNTSTSYTFRLPQKSTFLIGDCSDADEFRQSLRVMSQQWDTPSKFDFILLDPPWPNRSAKRKGVYSTEYNLQSMEYMLLRMDLDMNMAPGCLIGMWITNKAAVRELVLGSGGLFETWNVRLEEEWLWAKVTDGGDLVTNIRAVNTKPYEVLLLGRRQSTSIQAGGSETGTGAVKRRVIVAVRDLHSRKPCLKRLIEPLMTNGKDYRALEVFARHLVAGWWSWGNEVLKYNWEGCWTDEE